MASAYRVAAPSIRIVPWAALASCWPLPQQLLPVSATGGGRRRCTLGIFSGKNIYNFAILENLRIFQNCRFTGGVVEENGICSAAFCESAALRTCPLPLGGAVAQRLRGYRWRSEKSVKAIAPTGAALAFLCFDFFFRIVKGEQPLARCGVGGVQR